MLRSLAFRSGAQTLLVSSSAASLSHEHIRCMAFARASRGAAGSVYIPAMDFILFFFLPGGGAGGRFVLLL